MINREDWIIIKEMRSRGCHIKDIAHKLGCCGKTVSRALKRQGPPPPRKSGVRKSKLDDFKQTIDDSLADNLWNAEVIYTQLVQQGYTGGKTLLRDYIHPKRALRGALETTRFETQPGEQLQHDWGELNLIVAGESHRVYISVNVLSNSRRFFVWGAPRNDAEHTYESLIRSFEWFGGITSEVLVDNQKAAVLKHHHRGKPVFNEGFLMLACHYGFKPRACKPYRARTKGKVERMVRYVKEHFFQLYREFESFAHLNQLLEKWLMEVADQRIHNTLKEVVAERFEREQPKLQALPHVRFDTSYYETRRVPVDRYINVRGNRYSVPDNLVDQTVHIRIGLDGSLRIYDQQETMVAKHLLKDGRNRWVRQQGHHKMLHDAVHVETRDLSCYEDVE